MVVVEGVGVVISGGPAGMGLGLATAEILLCGVSGGVEQFCAMWDHWWCPKGSWQVVWLRQLADRHDSYQGEPSPSD